MLFRKDIAPRCEYCRHGVEIGGGEIACLKRGIYRAGLFCSKFRYDPIKRVPETRGKLNTEKFSEGDFEL
ncbi:MAG: hypothetical protein LBN99_01035 [Oscillospiraceae bacterium]|jgi:hypothetical protein|nr:hypothetical protein [Oscillospiraceae bacterium]